MKKKRILFFCILLCTCIVFFVLIYKPSLETVHLRESSKIQTHSLKETAYVERVIDGDTMDVLIDGKKERIRLIGIDAPEFGYEGKQTMCFAKEAYKKAQELLEKKSVKLEGDLTQDDRDTYKRLLRYVFLEDGTNINEEMIRSGFAREYTYKGIPYALQKEFLEVEKNAQAAKVALWQDNPCP
jgi:endonuclease YncB( thermonuclease family)